VSDRERGAVISRSAVRVDGRAVGHERGQGFSNWVSAGRVDDGGRSSWNVRSSRLGGSASMLARCNSYDAGRKARLGLGSRGVGYRARRKCGVGCRSFSSRMVLRRRRVARRVRLSTRGMHTTARVRRLLTVRCSRVNRRLAVRLAVRRGWIDWRLAVGVTVWCGWVHRRLAPDGA